MDSPYSVQSDQSLPNCVDYESHCSPNTTLNDTTPEVLFYDEYALSDTNIAHDTSSHSSSSNVFKYKLTHLNVNGWNCNNSKLREHILLRLPGYQWIGFNRKYQHVRAVRAFGGVGIFIREYIADEFFIKVIDKVCDGVLMVQFKQKCSEFTMVIIVAYLPPEHSKWGRNAENVFSHILGEVYKFSNVDLILLAGDLNSRIGDKRDCIEEIDHIKSRNIIDTNVNNHGQAFIDFLIESRMCILNGRFEPQHDGYTSISTKGTAVVDFIATRVDDFSMVSEFKVVSCSDIVQQQRLEPLLTRNCKVPDHAVLSCNFSVTTTVQTELACNVGWEPINADEPIKYNVQNIPEDFMHNQEGIVPLIEQIIQCRETQGEIDLVYNNLCELILNEMNDKLPKRSQSPLKNKHRRYRPKKTFLK